MCPLCSDGGGQHAGQHHGAGGGDAAGESAALHGGQGPGGELHAKERRQEVRLSLLFQTATFKMISSEPIILGLLNAWS